MGRIVGWEDGSDADAAVAQASSVLRAGGVAVFPTDTVYGIAQSFAANPDGPKQLFAIKRRDLAKTVPWLVGSPSDLDRYGTDVAQYARDLAAVLWPGGLTLIVRASSEVPCAYRAADATVALRLPASRLVGELVRGVGSALAATSANTSGCAAPTCFAELEARIIEESDVVVRGCLALGGKASTIVSCIEARPVVVRHGAIPWEEIANVLDIPLI